MLFLSGALSTTFNFQNNCPYTVWPGTLSGTAQLPLTGFELANGASQSTDAPDGTWSGRTWARTQCSTDSSGKFSCLTGDCGSGQVACNGAGGAPPATLAEFTLRGDGGKDTYDTSNVDGFNVPLSITPQGGTGDCRVTSCAANINSQCPSELQVKAPDGSVIGCKSACEAFGSDEYCCKGAFGSPTTCKPTNYSQIFKSACPTTYSYAYDDASSTFTCTGANYLITFCP